MSAPTTLREAMSRRVLLLDGAMGTEIQRRGLGGGNNDMLCLERPDVIADIHRSYLEAGADVISTCTFNAQRVSQADYDATDRIDEINAAGARIAVAEARRMTALTPDRPRFVVGSVGPTNKILSFSSDLTYEALEQAYVEQMVPLIREGVDGLLIETIVDTLNAKAAVSAARRAMTITRREVEILLSMTVADASGRTLSGQTIEAFVISIAHAKPLSVGLNCSFGAEGLIPYLRVMARHAHCFVSVHPNAGLPDECGNYVDTPDKMVGEMSHYLDERLVNMIGGCCGTTPDHIAAMRSLLDSRGADRVKREIPDPADPAEHHLAGLEPIQQADFVNVGERCNVAGSRKFLRLIKEGNYDEALAIARRQVEDGAMIIDINMDDGLLDTPVEMERFVRLIGEDPSIARVPLMIDSSRFEVIERALRLIQGKCVVNSISLKEGEEPFVERAKIIRGHGAAVIVMAFDEQGQATTYQRRVEICSRAYRLLVDKADFNPADIIFDPNILTVATGMAEHLDYAYDFTRASRWIHDNLPGARVSGGLSNLSFAFRGNNYIREAMHAVFLYRAIRDGGLDMAIMNPASAIAYDDIPPQLRQAIEDALFDRRDLQSTERLIELATAAAGAADTDTDTPQADTPRPDVTCRLRDALVKGDPSGLADDIAEALTIYERPVDIISGPLMEGMNEVGSRFAQGKMFLPQVVKTARTMNAAVDILTPHIEQSLRDADGIPAKSGKVLLATVKGDVHDIGKNIVAVVLSCNNFEVVDLGVMVPPEAIVEAALRERPDMIGLSGLITPSLDAMIETARQLAAAGVDVPLLIGGATTSDTHTALRIAPVYDGPVAHVRDAAHDVLVATKLLNPAERDTYVATLTERQKAIRDSKSAQASVPGSPLATDAPSHSSVSPVVVPPPFMGIIDHTPIAVSDLRGLIDWRYFYHLWRVKPDTPEADALRADAESVLDLLAADPEYCPRARYGFTAARSTGHSIIAGEEEIATPRQAPGQGRGDRLALCDFIAPDGDGAIGLFAVTMSPRFVAKLEQLKRGTDDYASLLWQSLGDRLAEAAAEYLHSEMAREYGWGGIRPAVGYPSLPDQSVIFQLDRIIQLSALGITLTETGAMYPQASIAGFFIAGGRYFDARPATTPAGE